MSAAGNPWTFTGRRLDGETGLMYYRARYYDVGLGRFISRDPIGYRGGINLYAYRVGHPSTLLDPSGMKCTPKKSPARDVSDKGNEETGIPFLTLDSYIWWYYTKSTDSSVHVNATASGTSMRPFWNSQGNVMVDYTVTITCECTEDGGCEIFADPNPEKGSTSKTIPPVSAVGEVKIDKSGKDTLVINGVVGTAYDASAATISIGASNQQGGGIAVGVSFAGAKWQSSISFRYEYKCVKSSESSSAGSPSSAGSISK